MAVEPPVQANELGINGIGIDISEFNTFISNTKIGTYDIKNIEWEINNILRELERLKIRQKLLNLKRIGQQSIKV